jgi:hypothetical protein
MLNVHVDVRSAVSRSLGRFIRCSHILLILLTFLVVALTRSLVINAIALTRDIDRRFDAIRVGLESEANAMVDSFLKASARDGRS